MKKILPFVFAFALFSCKEDASNTTQTIISGTITNMPDGKIILVGNSFDESITLNPDGTFTDTVDVPYSGFYIIEGTGNQLYLAPNKSLSIIYNAQKPDTISFTGDLAVENEYNFKKNRLQASVLGADLLSFFALPEADYLAKVEELNTKTLELLNATTFNVPEFKALEEKNIAYAKIGLLNNYGLYHGYATENPDFKPSESFPKSDSKLNFESEADLNFSPTYQQLLLAAFQDSITAQTKGGTSADDEYIALLTTIKSPTVKDYLISNLDMYFSPNSNDIEKLYKELSAQATNEKIKTELTEKYTKYKPLAKGQPSPSFDFENHKGGKTTLADLKGKYVYIDVWATWCGPCIQEIPALKKVEEQYKGKNITFVGISVDEKPNYDKWKKFVTARDLVGVQLIADNAWKSSFVKGYDITGIPRFILLDPNGNIVSADAPRPSDKALIKLFDELKIQ